MSKPDFGCSNSETDDTNELDPDPDEIWERVGDPGAGISIPEYWKFCWDMSPSIIILGWFRDMGGNWYTIFAISASGFDWAESDRTGGEIEEISDDALNEESVAVGSKSNIEEPLGVVDVTESLVLLSFLPVLFLLFDGWSSNSVINTGPWNKLFSSKISCL